MAAKKKASLRWLPGLLVGASGAALYLVPSADRLKVIVISAVLIPYAVGTFFYVKRGD